MPITPSESSPVVASNEAITDGLVQLSFVLQTMLRSLASEQGLSIQQVRMLGVLEDREIGMQQLSEILELEKSSVTGLVDRAERRGLVRRVSVPGDRRSVNVTLTPKGREIIGTVRNGAREEVDLLTEDLSPAQKILLNRSIALLIDRHTTRHAIPT